MLKLMPVVNFFKKRILKLGQCVLRQGDLMNHIYVVAQGRCKVVDISIRSRSCVKSFKIKGLRPKLRRLKHGPSILGKPSPLYIAKINMYFRPRNKV